MESVAVSGGLGLSVELVAVSGGLGLGLGLLVEVDGSWWQLVEG